MMIRSEHVYRQKWRDSREYCSSELSGLSREIGKLIEKLKVEKTGFSDKDRAEKILNNLEEVKKGIDTANLKDNEYLPNANPVTFNRKNKKKFKFYVRLKRKFCCNIKKIKKDLKSLEKRRECNECKYKYLQLSTEEYWEKIDCLIKNTEPKRISIARVLRDQWDSEQIIKLNQSGIPKYWRFNEQKVIDPETLTWWHGGIVVPILTMIAIVSFTFCYPLCRPDNEMYWEAFMRNTDGLYELVDGLIALIGLFLVVLMKQRVNKKIDRALVDLARNPDANNCFEASGKNGITKEKLINAIERIKEDCDAQLKEDCDAQLKEDCDAQCSSTSTPTQKCEDRYLYRCSELVQYGLNRDEYHTASLNEIVTYLNELWRSGAQEGTCRSFMNAIDENRRSY